MKRCRVTFQPGNRKIDVPAGMTLKEVINTARLDFDFPCGGRGKCGKCRVKILDGAGQPTPVEEKHLEREEIEKGIRLACMTVVQGDLVVELPYQETPKHKILLATGERDIKLDPHISKTCIDITPPSLEDQRPDWERLEGELLREISQYQRLKPSLSLLRRLPEVIRRAKYQVTAITEGDELLGLEEGDTTGELLGIAFDVGTTTIVGYLMDLRTGEQLSVASALNPQTRYGADVISRITYITLEEEGLRTLHNCVIEAINQLIGEAAEKAGVSPRNIYALTFVGNTCMHHLFLGINPKNLALAPYVPVVKTPLVLAARELGIEINEAGKVYVLPTIAGFVGADTVGVILATDLDWSEEIKLAIDIGTNGEIVLGSREKLLACSAAAGPAFEGAQIYCGMRGALGAIDHVRFGESVEYTVIGGVKPEGICGSGLIDAVAGLLELGIIDQNGRILSPHEVGNRGAERFRNSIVLHDGANAFLLAGESETAHGRPILITQRDIRELQLAKGAIATGIYVLMEKLGITTGDIAEVLLAGAFGNYLDPESACAIGLIPPELAGKVRGVGNAAGAGAIAALLSRGEFRRAALISESVEYVELSAYPEFNEIFPRFLVFPSDVDKSRAENLK
ncbi:MAG TPA: ferredoxin [Peptococcaceae bacterium]|nr:ferredoxin [Peptococcaceae bacterium]